MGGFGLDLIDWSQPVYVVEGIWDAITVQNTGRNCLAVMTNNPKHLWSWLKTLPVPIIAICEGDKAGKKLAKTGDFSVELPDGCDANELGLVKMNAILNKFEQNL